jgi:hypothetical protein
MNFIATAEKYAKRSMELKEELLNPELRKSNYNILTSSGEEYSRIYHVHIRKCAGTSFNFKFIGNSCDHDPEAVRSIYQDTAKKGRSLFNGRVFCGWRKSLIESGKYFYAWSHIPFHELDLPQNTFTITTLRDPLQRLISHYKMIYGYYETQTNHPCMKVEGKWLGESKSIIEFAKNMPKEHLMAQLFHFSKSYSETEAVDEIKKVNFTSEVEKLNSEGYRRLEKIIPSISLPNGKVRESSAISALITKRDEEYLSELLEKEYRFLELLKNNVDP